MTWGILGEKNPSCVSLWSALQNVNSKTQHLPMQPRVTGPTTILLGSLLSLSDAGKLALLARCSMSATKRGSIFPVYSGIRLLFLAGCPSMRFHTGTCGADFTSARRPNDWQCNRVPLVCWRCLVTVRLFLIFNGFVVAVVLYHLCLQGLKNQNCILLGTLKTVYMFWEVF